MINEDKKPLRDYSIEGVNDSEDCLGIIHKHLFGLIIFYLQVFIGVTVIGFLVYLAFPSFASEATAVRYGMLTATSFVLLAGLMGVIMLVATYIYRQNKLIITDKNLTQILQHSLFNRQVSELSMANVEDVTAFQKGIFASIFNFGELRVETAGEQNNFHFSYCPNPNHYGRMILDARQKFIDGDPVAAKRANERLTLPRKNR